MKDAKYGRAVDDVRDALADELNKHDEMASIHDGFDKLVEELQEVEKEVRRKPDARDIKAMRGEAAQLAAKCIRFMAECAD